MKFALTVIALMMTLGCSAFANYPAGASTQNLVDASGALVKSGNATGIISTYITMVPAAQQTLADRIVDMVAAGPAADDEFLEFMKRNIPENPRLESDAFDLPLVDASGKKHLFSYRSDYARSLFILNYTIAD